jgi:peptidoglycan/xylan/chitin deacetylase (PgdA/CDA1 family)
MLKNVIHNIVFFVVNLITLIGCWFFGWSIWIFIFLLVVSFLIKISASFFIRWQYFMPVLYRGDEKSGAIALTFDDGPIAGKTDRILSILKEKNVPATFFCIGKRIEGNDELLRQMDHEGHIVANHSFNHQKNFPVKNSALIVEELLKTDQAISEIIHKKPVFFRPPFGVTNPVVAFAVRRTKHKTIGWTVRSFDTVIKNKHRLWNRISNVQAGDIVLLHDYSDTILEILPDYIDHVRKSGLKIVRLDELLRIEAYA